MGTGNELEQAAQALQQMLKKRDYSRADTLLPQSKALLLRSKALIPSQELQASSPATLRLALEILESGALITIQKRDAEGFIRYVKQLQTFYDFYASLQPAGQLREKPKTQESKITGLYLLLLLIQRDNAGFHMMIEKLEMADSFRISKGNDANIQYPIRIEQWLSEGVYDKVWKATTGSHVPSEEFNLFTDILHNTIRTEIASCAARSYPSLKVSHAKTMLFLSSEKEAADFAHSQAWSVRDGRIYFPKQEEERSEQNILVVSGNVIENTIGYTRNLEQIV